VAGGKASTRVTVAAGGGVRADLRDDKTGFAAIRVNSGGGAFVDSMQQAWSADYGYLGGNSYAVPDAGADLYRTERYGAFRYRFDVPAGNYRVNLHFAEIFFSRPGERVFDVFINGQKALVNFDIVAAAGGPNRAVVRQFDVSLPAPGMVIELAPRVENAKISGIEILPAGANR
ncbi:MAG TPA: malectin domain-containing carbohydrate-binding protein, partial [Bryobacteraceae bacterium]|nr:malectin domain-containing carbohydrate-binding protein [Bryobacteraceae bacterium]